MQQPCMWVLRWVCNCGHVCKRNFIVIESFDFSTFSCCFSVSAAAFWSHVDGNQSFLSLSRCAEGLHNCHRNMCAIWSIPHVWTNDEIFANSMPFFRLCLCERIMQATPNRRAVTLQSWSWAWLWSAFMHRSSISSSWSMFLCCPKINFFLMERCKWCCKALKMIQQSTNRDQSPNSLFGHFFGVHNIFGMSHHKPGDKNPMSTQIKQKHLKVCSHCLWKPFLLKWAQLIQLSFAVVLKTDSHEPDAQCRFCSNKLFAKLIDILACLKQSHLQMDIRHQLPCCVRHFCSSCLPWECFFLQKSWCNNLSMTLFHGLGPKPMHSFFLFFLNLTSSKHLSDATSKCTGQTESSTKLFNHEMSAPHNWWWQRLQKEDAMASESAASRDWLSNKKKVKFVLFHLTCQQMMKINTTFCCSIWHLSLISLPLFVLKMFVWVFNCFTSSFHFFVFCVIFFFGSPVNGIILCLCASSVIWISSSCLLVVERRVLIINVSCRCQHQCSSPCIQSREPCWRCFLNVVWHQHVKKPANGHCISNGSKTKTIKHQHHKISQHAHVPTATDIGHLTDSFCQVLQHCMLTWDETCSEVLNWIPHACKQLSCWVRHARKTRCHRATTDSRVTTGARVRTSSLLSVKHMNTLSCDPIWSCNPWPIGAVSLFVHIMWDHFVSIAVMLCVKIWGKCANI